ncbi:MAG: hypothetical protein JO287_23505 [Pseudonocardiales bacterium]|nr:hypothetical protein [Pseudonocardiales bacterium]
MAHGGKALRPLPAAHKETRGSSTYLNLLVRDAARRTAGTRAAAVRSIRALPHSLDLIEVETPMLRIVRGGATARLFLTYSNVFNTNLCCTGACLAGVHDARGVYQAYRLPGMA